ncbi:hypothetical protein B6U74_05870 [Candidatus Bathyarchaeota archaeon ex4484_205]|nr:MAG: hypothetical protein B6U74_05870 [Candidatus Bathyarchaeota archaeon ex4484_205]
MGGGGFHKKGELFLKIMDSEERVELGRKLAFVLDTIIRSEDILGSGKILELGCGTGRILVPLAKFGYKYYGLDISPTYIRKAEERAVRENVTMRLYTGSVLDMEEILGGRGSL